MGKLAAYAGPILFLFFFFFTMHHVGLYGQRWGFNQHGVPVSLVTPDARYYRDGSPVDPVGRAMILNGVEEPFIVVMLLITVVCGLMLIPILRTRRRRLRELADARQYLQDVLQLKVQLDEVLRERRRSDDGGHLSQ